MTSKRPGSKGPKGLAELRRKSRARREHLAAQSVYADQPATLRNDLTPTLELVEMDIDVLTLPARRVRKSDQAQAQRIGSAMAQLGYCRPILIDNDNVVVDGVSTLEAARQLGITKLSCIVISHLTKAQLRLLRISLNRLGETGGWNFDELKLEFEELAYEELPLEISGFSAPEIDLILMDEAPAAHEVGELEPQPTAIPVTILHDIWVLGSHRLACGDSRSGELMSRLMHGLLARVNLTDEPYNVRVQGHITKGDHREFAMASGEMSDSQFLQFNIDWMTVAASHIMDGGLLATFIDWRGCGTVLEAARALGLSQINLVVWNKTNAGQGSLYRSQHELLPIFKVGTAPHINNVELGRHGRWRSNVWTYPGASSLGSDARDGLKLHPTVKPTTMLQDALLDLTLRGEIVLDVFAGSGSIFMAAEETGRRAFGVEIDPLYCDVAVRRWETLTGEKAVLESTGETFDQVTARRGVDGAEPCPVLLLPAPVLMLTHQGAE